MILPTLATVRRLDPAVLGSAAAAADDARAHMTGAADAIQDAADTGLDGWTGDAAHAATRSLQRSAARAQLVGTREHAVAEAVTRFIGPLVTARDTVFAAVQDAGAQGMAVNGVATAGPDIAETGFAGPTAVPYDDALPGTAAAADAERAAERATTVIRDALRGFATVDADAAAALDAAVQAVSDAAAASGPLELLEQFLPRTLEPDLPPPPVGGTPEDNRAYWDGLTAAQRTEMIRIHPATVGSMDGLPADARHRANMALLDTAGRDLKAAEHRLADEYSSSLARFIPLLHTDTERRLDRVRNKITDVDAVRTVMAEHPSARLMLLDTHSGDRVRAAVAVGDPDTAENVSVTTPGDNTTAADSLRGMVDEAEDLREEAEAQIAAVRAAEGAGPGGAATAPSGSGSVAAIAWVGYDTPQVPTSATGVVSAIVTDPVGLSRDIDDTLTPDTAISGAGDLAPFLDGVDVASQQPDPHITALGHSYGSVTTALAARMPALHDAVDDAVFYGSPGLEACDADTLNLPDHHAFVLEADGDVIADAGVTGIFGPDPGECDGFDQLSTDTAITADGIHRAASEGHSEYARPDEDGDLRTSGYNMAAVVAGLPENLIYR